ncbi:Glutamyl-tRNA(Gln) amidotransferase subunit A, mitochondrial [Zancudomyces culisetae]|uniref:Glutamyl-tRNA(Gln) amidotransferase subunit A, mitochondrial n=1 Tax=Zancudomyces culisetae TaxID=1213189 RepID=A0A1R1PDV0_ZANCU|nr:Glutamyl-tRNA(Gln) amidotransferase subunit A, mitochondrial [Zancudomyces culisetae]|eukprot:OMH79099.1 Glutamyl-tRNA(Gln) amidotransferase subunit A, mitochondrial [Zancudomyces culisetae]
MDTIKDHNTTRNDPTDEPNHALIVPPLNFSMIMPGIYRSGFPSVKNHQFLLELGLKSIIYVSDSKCLDYHTTFCKDNNIEFTHYKVKLNNEPFKEMEQAAVCKIITKMLDTRNHPILVHCDRGVRRTGWITTKLHERIQHTTKSQDNAQPANLHSAIKRHSSTKCSESANNDRISSIIKTLDRIYTKLEDPKASYNSIIDLREKEQVVQDYASFLKQIDTKSENDTRSLQRKQSESVEGKTLFVKGNYSTKGEPTTCGSKALFGYDSPISATVVDLLENSGALILGKTNLDEFGMGSSTTFSAYGPTKHFLKTNDGLEAVNKLKKHVDVGEITSNETQNSVNLEEDRCSGGSSGGSAVVVGAGLWSDTGGSVRLPASWCGVVGFKPSYGQCSRYGLVEYASSLDTVGILGESVSTTKAVYKTMAKYDSKDMSCLPEKARSALERLYNSTKGSNSVASDHEKPNLKGIRVGIPQEYYIKELSESVVQAWKHTSKILEQMGAEVVKVSLPHTKYALSTYYTIAPAEASSNLARYDGIRYGYKHTDEIPDEASGTSSTSSSSYAAGRSFMNKYAYTRAMGLGPEVQRRIMLGTFVLSVGTLRCKNPTESAVDLLLVPTGCSTAPPLSAFSAGDHENKSASSDYILHSYVNDVMTVPSSLAGLPSISIPVGISKTDGFPIGLQLISQFGNDDSVLDVALKLEQALLNQNTHEQDLFGNYLPLVPKIFH